ncbi:MAG TPA: crosslink repair DNA glycosylase YcaQ family protein, partial [Solirubrobacter sp.]
MGEATLRARGQWLHAPGGDVLRHLLAVQAQDVRTPALALGVRGGALDASMRITWLMRQTLHLVHASDLEWLHPLFAPRMRATNERRLRQLAVSEADADRAVGLIAARV